MDFGNLETQIASFLEVKIDNSAVEVIALPESESEFEKVFRKEKIIVAFSDDEPDANVKSTSIVYQNTNVTFAFLIQSNSLRGSNQKLGVYAIQKLIKKHMIGFTPLGGNAFTYAGFKMQEKANDVFQYAVYFKTKSFEVQETDNDNSSGANLQEITYT